MAADVDRKQVEKILPEFEAYVRKTMAAWKTPGVAIAVVLGDRMIYAKGFGVRRAGAPGKVDTKTIFPIGSTTKAFASVSMAMAVDAGHLRWSDRVVDHIPSFRMYDPWVGREFRILDLMAQRSGLPAHSVSALAEYGYDRAQIMRAIGHIPPVSSFRSAYAYQNGFFLVAGELVARKAGEPSWEAYVKKRILDPLSMTSTSSDLASIEKAPNATSAHLVDGDRIVQATITKFAYVFGGAGGLNSNVEDMSKWIALQLNGGRFGGKQIVSARNLAFTHRPQIGIGNGTAYAQGWVVMRSTPHPIIWHNGSIPGILNVVAIVPEVRLGIVVLTNATPSMPEPLAFRFFDLVFGNPAKDYAAEVLVRVKAAQAAEKNVKRPSPAAPPAAVERYVGDYGNPALGTITVAKDGTGMTMAFGPKRHIARLTPWDGEVFRVHFTGVMLQPGFDDAGFVTFERGTDGNATKLHWKVLVRYDFERIPKK